MASCACCNDPVTLSDIAVKDTNRLVGSVAKCLAANSPFINLLDGGTFPSGVSDTVRSVVQMPAAPGDSLAIPTFVNDTEVCGTRGLQDLTGSVEFTYSLQTKRGFGPRVCVKKGYSAFKTGYTAAENSLTKLITQYINADIKAQLYLKSATKFVMAQGYCFDDLLTGGSETDVDVLFAPVTPDSPLTFKALYALIEYLSEELFADKWPANGKGQEHYRFIGSSRTIEGFRNELGVAATLCCLAGGGYRLGETALSGYSFESSPAYRGAAFGIDQTPLRATGFNQDGTLALVNPKVVVTDMAKNTAYSRVNPAWRTAPIEVGFLVAPGSFKRLVPERYVGEGSFRFAPQLHMGELEWFYQRDADCNIWGDYGHHIYQIIRAYQPVRPQWIIPIAYKRCDLDLGATDCPVTSCLPYTGAVL